MNKPEVQLVSVVCVQFPWCAKKSLTLAMETFCPQAFVLVLNMFGLKPLYF